MTLPTAHEESAVFRYRRKEAEQKNDHLNCNFTLSKVCEFLLLTCLVHVRRENREYRRGFYEKLSGVRVSGVSFVCLT